MYEYRRKYRTAYNRTYSEDDAVEKIYGKAFEREVGERKADSAENKRWKTR